MGRTPALRHAGLAALAAVAAVAAGCGGGTVRSPHQRTTSHQLSPAPGSWLGAAFNSSSGSEAGDALAAVGAVYDRSGALEIRAGQTPGDSRVLAQGLGVSLADGMIPDVEIDPAPGPSGCAGDPNASTRCLPTTPGDVAAYVRGFVTSARAIIAAHHGRRIVFEPMNEPWDWGAPPGVGSGRTAAAEYAAILARLLPVLHGAHVDLAEVYVPGAGRMSDGSWWINDLYIARPCLAPGPNTCGPVEGWNLHPYGLPHQLTAGIGSVPAERSQMRSGRWNLIVSEIGFCARDVNRGAGCQENAPEITGSGAQTARWMAATLRAALAMRRAGWLKGLIIWDRAGDGWAMERDGGGLTPQGRAFVRFARSVGGGVR